MSDREHCSNCAQAHNCKSVYEQLGKATGSSIAGKAVAVFLGPLLVFVVCLVVLEKKLAAVTGSEALGILLSAALGVGASFVYILVTRAIIARRGAGRSSCQMKENNDRN